MVKKTKQFSIGIDIGGTKIRAVMFDGKRVVADYELATPPDDIEHFFIMLKAVVEPLQEKAKELKVQINGIGLGIAGTINYQERRVLNSPNLTIIEGIKICERVEELLELPTKLDNDANAFVRAEALIGAAKGHKNVYGLTIGTGIGGAWWYGDKVYLGAFGGAGEPGHQIIELASGLDLEKTYQKLTQSNAGKLAQEAYRGDVLAEKAFGEVGSNFGIALANIANIIDPEVFVLGGSVMQSSDLFLGIVKKTMKEHIMSSESAKRIKILKAKLGQDAGAIGAALLVA